MGQPDEAVDEITVAASERMTFFSDAVVAIAITLLAIDLPVPDGANSAELMASVGNYAFEYGTFVISFVVIGTHWLGHHRVFRYVRRTDGAIVRLNFLWLLLIVLNPFLTKVLTEGDMYFARFAMYAGAQAVQLCTFSVMMAVLTRKGAFAAGAPAWLTTRSYLRSLVGAGGFLISLAFFPLIGPWAFAFWGLFPMVVGRALRLTGVLLPRGSAGRGPYRAVARRNRLVPRN